MKELSLERFATSYNVLKPRPWKIYPCTYVEEGGFYVCSHFDEQTREELPVEFFNHELASLDLQNEDDIKQFITEFGMPLMPIPENIAASNAFNEAVFMSIKRSKVSQEENVSQDYFARLSDDLEELREKNAPNTGVLINEFIDSLLDPYHYATDALSAVKACFAATTNIGVRESCKVKAYFLEQYINRETDCILGYYVTHISEIKSTLFYARYALKGIKAFQGNSLIDIQLLSKLLKTDEESAINMLEAGDGFINASINGITNKVGFFENGRQHIGRIIDTKRNFEEEGYLTEALGAQLYNAAISKTHWRECEKCGTLFKYRRSSNAKYYQHSDSSYCCDECSNAHRQAKYRRKRKATEAAKKGIPLSEVMKDCEPEYIEAMKEAYLSVVKPAR